MLFSLFKKLRLAFQICDPDCHNPILGYSPKLIFFQNKN